eukprot:COSAG02_NODE_491_length_21224_cov_5.973680_15_plen_54_part_00
MFAKDLLGKLRFERLVTHSSITSDEGSFYTSSAVDVVNKHLQVVEGGAFGKSA